MHERKIILFEAARELLRSANIELMPNDIDTLKKRIEMLNVDANKLLINLNAQKKKVTDINYLKSYFETYLKNNQNHTDNEKDGTLL